MVIAVAAALGLASTASADAVTAPVTDSTTIPRTPRIAPADGELLPQSSRIGGLGLEPAHLVVGTSSRWFSSPSFLFPDDEHYAFGQQFTLMAGLGRGLTLRADTTMLRARNRLAIPDHFRSFGDSRLRLRWVMPVGERLHLGAETGADLYVGIPNQTGIFDGLSPTLRHVGHARLPARLGLHWSLGLDWDRAAAVLPDTPTLVESTLYGIGAHPRLAMSLRPEFDLRPLLVFLDWQAALPIGAPIGALEGPQWLTPGVALRLRETVSLQAGVSLALVQPRTRGVQVPEPWTAQLGVSAHFDGREAWARLRQWLNPKPAVLAIDVRDALRREPLKKARLTIFTPDEGPVEGIDGGLTWYGFADAVTWIAGAPDYATVTGTTVLRGGERTETSILLPPTRGWIVGEASAPGTAAVELRLDGPEPVSTALRGSFTMSLLPGRYAGYATAPGAVSQPIEAILGLGQTVTWPAIRLRAPEPVRAPKKPGEPVVSHAEVERQQRQLSGVIDEILRKPAAPPQAERGRADLPPTPTTTERQIRLGDKAATMEGQSLATFTVGATVLDGEARARVAALARIVQRDPRIRFVIVEGSTDDIGDRSINTRISTERALAVYQVMIDEGVPPEKIGLKISFFALTPERIDDKTREGERQVRIRFIRDEGGDR